MDMRTLVSLIGTFAIAGSIAFSGDSINGKGRPSDGDCGETQGGENGDGGSDNSDPINLSTGGFQHHETDLVIPGRGLDFEIKRYYRSYSGLQSYQASHGTSATNFQLIDPFEHVPMGYHWDFNYNMRLSYSAGFGPEIPFTPDPIDPINLNQIYPGVIHLSTGKGRIENFTRYSPQNPTQPISGTAYYSNEFYPYRIEYTVQEHAVQMTTSDLTTYQFFPAYDYQYNLQPYAGRLQYITDRNGNRITFHWETSSQGVERIDKAIDTLGHEIDFVYHNESYAGQTSTLKPTTPTPTELEDLEQLIWKIVDTDTDRVFTYMYSEGHTDPSDDPLDIPVLTSVTEPAIEDSAAYPLPAEHERFPNGRRWEYTYDTTGNLRQWWEDRMLTSITSPNGDVILENEYYYFRSGTRNDRNDGRVIRQKYGNDANDNDVEYNYVVTTIDGDLNLPSHNGTGPDYYVWVNDRRGAITRFKYAGSDNPDAVHRELLEKVEFEGLVDDPDVSVFASYQNGVLTGWNKLDEVNYTAVAYSGPKLPDQTPATATYSYEWDTNQDWNPTACYLPGSDYEQTSYVDSTQTDDPRLWGAITGTTRYSASTMETINEGWAYNFDVSGGCGCGADSFATGYSNGRNIVTFKQYDTTLDPVTGNPNGDLLYVYHDMTGYSVNSTHSQIINSIAPNATKVDEYTYNDWGQVLTHKHPEKIVINSQGNEETHRRVDQYEYHNTPNDLTKHGRLHKKHIDVNGFNLITTYEYDLAGNVIKEIHPDGDVSKYLYNQASQMVQEQHFDDNNVLFAQTDYFYDANGNVVREEIKNLAGDPPVVQANASITTVHQYDIHDYRTHTSREHGDFSGTITEDSATGVAMAPITNTSFATEQWDYDGAKNLIKYHYGQAVNQTPGEQQTSNTITYEYDARDLLIKKQQGEGATEGDTLITTAEYDDRGRPVVIYVNEEGSASRKYTIEYDGFNRIRYYEDPMGNRMNYQYDGNHNVTKSYFAGPVGADTSDYLSGTPEDRYTLFSQAYEYTNSDLLSLHSVDIYDYDYALFEGPAEGFGPHSIDQQVTDYAYNRDDSLKSVTETSGDSLVDKETKFFYDTASRLEIIEDNDLNVTMYVYDAESNVTKQTRIDQPTLGSSSAQTFIVDREYDALDRLVKTIDGTGNETAAMYDSRSNMIEQIDPRGNLTEYFFDGMNRLTKTRVKMTDTGDGTGNPLSGGAQYIVTEKSYDDSSRLIENKDDAGNVTSYTYDGLNRLLTTKMPDDAVYTSTYDANGNLKSHTDARGVVITHQYDRNNRLTSRLVDSVLEETFTYDGLGRILIAANNNSVVHRHYDSRSNVVYELQNSDAPSFPGTSSREVEYSYDDANNNSQIVYANGRVINRAYDHLNRLLSISDPSLADPITEFDYVGRRLERRAHGNDTATSYDYNGYQGALVELGDKGFGRINKISTSNTNTSTVLDAFRFTWDESQNRVTYRDVGSDTDDRRERLFGYDSFDRLDSSGVVYPDINATKTDDTTSYVLDDDHNRLSVSELVPSGENDAGTGLGTYELTGDQAKNNQYSITPREDGSEWVYHYDQNGNLVLMVVNEIADFNDDYTLNYFDTSDFLAAYGNQDSSADINGDGLFNQLDISAFLQAYSSHPTGLIENRHFTYDFRNQLTNIKHYDGPTTVIYEATNVYDPFARRVVETVDDGSVTTDTQFVYGGASLWEVLERVDRTNGQSMATHVFGIGIDDEVGYRIEGTTDIDIWTHRDDLGSLTSITDDAGAVLERYEYGDYGQVTIRDASGGLRSTTHHSALHLYTGRSMIPGSGLYDYRYRVMDPVTGRFMQRDPLGYFDSMNVYSYVLDSPFVYGDPLGLSPNFDPEPVNPETGQPVSNRNLQSKCDRLRKAIENNDADIKDWEEEYKSDPCKLQKKHGDDHDDAPDGEKDRTKSRKWHLDRLNNAKNKNAQLKAAYDKHCGPGSDPNGHHRALQDLLDIINGEYADAMKAAEGDRYGSSTNGGIGGTSGNISGRGSGSSNRGSGGRGGGAGSSRPSTFIRPIPPNFRFPGAGGGRGGRGGGAGGLKYIYKAA